MSQKLRNSLTDLPQFIHIVRTTEKITYSFEKLLKCSDKDNVNIKQFVTELKEHETTL